MTSTALWKDSFWELCYVSVMHIWVISNVFINNTAMHILKGKRLLIGSGSIPGNGITGSAGFPNGSSVNLKWCKSKRDDVLQPTARAWEVGGQREPSTAEGRLLNGVQIPSPCQALSGVRGSCAAESTLRGTKLSGSLVRAPETKPG